MKLFHRCRSIKHDAFIAQVEIFSKNMEPEIDRCREYSNSWQLKSLEVSSDYDRYAFRYGSLTNISGIIGRVQKFKKFKIFTKINNRITSRIFENLLGMYERVTFTDIVINKVPKAMLNKEFSAYARDLSLPHIADYIDKAIDWEKIRAERAAEVAKIKADYEERMAKAKKKAEAEAMSFKPEVILTNSKSSKLCVIVNAVDVSDNAHAAVPEKYRRYKENAEFLKDWFSSDGLIVFYQPKISNLSQAQPHSNGPTPT